MIPSRILRAVLHDSRRVVRSIPLEGPDAVPMAEAVADLYTDRASRMAVEFGRTCGGYLGETVTTDEAHAANAYALQAKEPPR